MSLKHMKALAVLCKNEGYTPEIIAMGEAAMEEIRALEKAAAVFAGYAENRYPSCEALSAAARLMESIVKGAK